MTAAERQQPHRDIVTRVPLTKSVREDLQRLISNREKVMNRRRCNARPNCSPSSSSGWPPIYKWDQDESGDSAIAALEVIADFVRSGMGDWRWRVNQDFFDGDERFNGWISTVPAGCGEKGGYLARPTLLAHTARRAEDRAPWCRCSPGSPTPLRRIYAGKASVCILLNYPKDSAARPISHQMIKPPAMGEVECTKPIGRTEEVKPADTGTVIDRHVVVYELVCKVTISVPLENANFTGARTIKYQMIQSATAVVVEGKAAIVRAAEIVITDP